MPLSKQWDLLRNGHRPALEHLYKATADRLIDYGCRFTSDRQLVEDAVHDTFVRIWKNRKTISPSQSPTAYLMLSVKRDIIRKSGKLKGIDGTEDINKKDFSAGLSIEDMLIKNEADHEQSLKLKAAFDQLSSRQKEAIYLKYYQNKSYEEVSEIMEMNYQSVRNLVFRALTSLRKVMLIMILFLNV